MYFFLDTWQVVSAEDLNLGCYTIEDVTLPMPGSRVIYPTNDVAKVYHDLADKDRISLTECVHNVKEFSIANVTGSYRRVFQKPINFEWELLKYADSTKPLVETDLDKIIKSKPVNGVRPVGASDAKKEDNTRELENSNDGANIEADDNEIEGEEVILPQDESVSGTNSQDFQTALKMSFTLPTSCYATMAIRELLKTSTSVAYHKTLNQ